MNKKKILVTGVAGFIGFHLVNKLIYDGMEVIGIDNLNNYYDVKLKFDRLFESEIKKEDIVDGKLINSNKYPNYSFAKIDLIENDKLEKLFRKHRFKYVINLAAQAGVRFSVTNPRNYIESNILGFFNILELCKKYKVDHFVYASSSSVYGDSSKISFTEKDIVDSPVSLYAATKKSNELLAYSYSKLYNLPTSGLRYFTVYGPWGRPDMAPILFSEAIMKRKKINVYNDGKMLRDFTFIDDVINGTILTLKNKSTANCPYQILNIGKGVAVNLLDFISILENKIGVKSIIKLMPMQLGDVKETCSDINSLIKLGYSPKIDLEKGISLFVDWFKNYYLYK